VRVADDDQGPASAALGAKHEVEGLPTLIVVHDATGEPRRLEGYAGKRRTLAFLKRAATPKAPGKPGERPPDSFDP
jgi:hypothetical protein